MKRIHLFEFEDLSWFPGWLRDRLTRFIVAMHKILGTGPVLADLIAKALPYAEEQHVIDMCSGESGPMLEVVEHLRKDHGYPEVQLTLSDLYPNKAAIKHIAQLNDPKVQYLEKPMNATHLDPALKGVRTMICSMHHMRPPIAKSILKDAQQAQQPICIYEISDNSFPKWIWWIAMPINFLMVFFVTPLVRPMTWQQLVFTYIFPVLPFFIAWDGAVSNARTYTLEDMDLLLQDLQSNDYTWEKGTIKGKGGNKLYLLGLPKQG